MIGEGTIQSRGLLTMHKGVLRFDAKVYPFSEGFDEIFGSTPEALRYVAETLADFNGVLRKPRGGRLFAYGIAFPWGYVEHGGPVRKIDFCGFEYDRAWDECNPVARLFGLTNGKPGKGAEFCETGLMVLGKEGDLRRAAAESGYDIGTYLNSWPELGVLGPVDPKIYRHNFGSPY
ncbi:MAG: hypothetical protein GW780_05455 [Candidatus Aenigmarchaeota archaeon]|nr:hypothetical protein [Candidatus Aenigmarchaeota archaeon]